MGTTVRRAFGPGCRNVITWLSQLSRTSISTFSLSNNLLWLISWVPLHLNQDFGLNLQNTFNTFTFKDSECKNEMSYRILAAPPKWQVNCKLHPTAVTTTHSCLPSQPKLMLSRVITFLPHSATFCHGLGDLGLTTVIHGSALNCKYAMGFHSFCWA